MEKFTPYEKLSKKEKRRLDLVRRQTWGELNPVTRKPQSSKAYNRKKAQNWKKDLPDSVPSYFQDTVNAAFISRTQPFIAPDSKYVYLCQTADTHRCP